MNVYIITSAKFEECYIEEWVKYHLNIGFDKIIINDNNPKNYLYNINDILQKYINNGQVIVERYWDTHNYDEKLHIDVVMPDIYWWLYEKYKNEFDWFAKLDVDEYLEIPETNNNIKEFLQQEKFNNSLSIVIPFKHFAVKQEYSYLYERSEHIADKYTPFIDPTYSIYDFKSIIKNTDFLTCIGLHYGYFAIYFRNNDYILYALPNGENATDKLFIENIEVTSEERENHIKQYKDFIKNNISNICHINHFCWKSVEEQVNHCIKFEANKHDEWCLHEHYIELLKQYPELFNNPRDLYKIYFLNNENN